MLRRHFRRRRFLRNPDVEVGLSEEVLEQRRNSFLDMMQQVRQGTLPREAIEEMYTQDPAWQLQPLSQVLKNIMGKDYSLDPGELAALSEKGSQLRGVWSHRRAWLANLETQAVAIAHQAQRAYDGDEDGDEEEVPSSSFSRSSSKPMKVSLYTYNIWVYSGEDYFVPYRDYRDYRDYRVRKSHAGSNNLAEAEALLAKAIAEDTIAALLPKKINQKAYNIWELDPETEVWLPAVYKQERPGKPSRAIHLGHSDEKTAQKMATRWRTLTQKKVEVLDFYEDSHIPVFRYQPLGGAWRR